MTTASTLGSWGWREGGDGYGNQREREGGRSSRKSLHLIHGAGGPAVPSGAHELHRRRPLAEDGVGQNVEPVYFHQHGGVTQPGDPETRARLGEVRVLDEIRLHHRQLGIQSLRRKESKTPIQLEVRGQLVLNDKTHYR